MHLTPRTLMAFLFLISCTFSFAGVVEYELTIDETSFAPAGKQRAALSINGGIPGPTLRFREGDVAKVTVRNALKDDTTSIHWHGLILPNEMDGVPHITTPPIQPGGSHVFEFPIVQTGTYWYHSHTKLQEQRGVYGAIVIEPKEGAAHRVDREYVVVMSDWTNEKPIEVMRTLMRGSEYYAIEKGNAQSIVGAMRKGRMKDYLQREKSRMNAMDVSDVYYDAFLVNGQREQELEAAPGETVLVRLINASAATYFYVSSATGPMTIVAADGPAVTPANVERLLMGIAETYDVLVTIPESGAWELRATAQDNSGHASVFIGTGDRKAAAGFPDPELYSMDEMLESGMASMDHAGMEGMEGVEGMEMEAMEEVNPERPQAPYQLLRSETPTELPADAPVREIELRLTGDMVRYIWSFNGKTYAEEPTVAVHEGEVLRIVMINDTMMHHPIHLHGHFFRLLNAHGEHSPLKHTVDVPPMGRRTIEFLANERGDWLFHCHLLYHMHAGMTRVFSYAKGDDPAYEPAHDPAHKGHTMPVLEGTILSNMSSGHAHIMRGRETLGLHWHYDYHTHEGDEHSGLHLFDDEHEHGAIAGEYEVDFHWNHYFGPNLSTSLGYRLSNEEGTGNRGFGQVMYRLPYMIETSVALDTRGDLRLGLGREFQITPRLSATVETEYDTNSGFEWESYAHYLLTKQFSLTGGYDSEHGWGAGLSFRF